MYDKSKVILFKDDIGEKKISGAELCFVKFLDEEKRFAIFYKPAIAPKYLDNFIEQNNIEMAYELKDDNLLKEYHDSLYSFIPFEGVYEVTKGVEIKDKLVLLVGFGMEIDLNLPKYFYELKNGKIYLNSKKQGLCKGFCYVANKDEVNEQMQKFMIPVSEAIPNVLSLNGYDIKNKQLVKNK